MLDDLKCQGVKFRSLTEHIDTDTPAGRATWQMIGLLAELSNLAVRTTVSPLESLNPQSDSLSNEQDAGPLDRCPRCKVGSMRPLEMLLPHGCAIAPPCATLPRVPQMDTS
jgi:hypothetical protein